MIFIKLINIKNMEEANEFCNRLLDKFEEMDMHGFDIGNRTIYRKEDWVNLFPKNNNEIIEWANNPNDKYFTTYKCGEWTSFAIYIKDNNKMNRVSFESNEKFTEAEILHILDIEEIPESFFLSNSFIFGVSVLYLVWVVRYFTR